MKGKYLTAKEWAQEGLGNIISMDTAYLKITPVLSHSARVEGRNNKKEMASHLQTYQDGQAGSSGPRTDTCQGRAPWTWPWAGRRQSAGKPPPLSCPKSGASSHDRLLSRTPLRPTHKVDNRTSDHPINNSNFSRWNFMTHGSVFKNGPESRDLFQAHTI